MQTPKATPASACVCTGSATALTAAGVQRAVSQCGEFATIGQIITAMGGNPRTMTRATELEVRTWLEDAGWGLVKRTSHGVRVWGYMKRAGKGDQPDWEKDALMAAIVHRPQPGQLLLPILIRRPYAAAATVELVNLNALQRSLALSLLSCDNSLNIASTSAALHELSTALASALALCNRSKAAMNSSVEPGATSMDCSSLSRTSNASGASSDSVMDFSQVLSKHSHGNAGLAAHLAGGAA